MKTLVLSLYLISINTLGFAQNILDALQLKSDRIGKYVEGELMATDTIIDLNNGYYEEFSSHGGGSKTINRQAAIFHNTDGTRTLGISITEYDFVCFYTATNFYEITKSKDSISTVLHAEILPELTIRDFLLDTTVISVLRKYFAEIQQKYLEANADMDKLLAEIYHTIYLLPQRGTSLIATLKVCDYIPTNVVNITTDDWSVIENSFGTIELEYDKTEKKFKRRPAKNQRH